MPNPLRQHDLRGVRLAGDKRVVRPASARVLQKNGFEEEGAQRCAVVKSGVVHDLRVFAHVCPPK
jgi:hypothetical protein